MNAPVRRRQARPLFYVWSLLLWSWGAGATPVTLDDGGLEAASPEQGVADPVSIASDQLFNDVRMASGEDLHLVVWADARTGVHQIYGARVRPDGTILDPYGISLSETFATHTDAAFDGTNFLVVWNSSGTILGTRVSVEGRVLDPRPITLPSHGDPFSTAPRVSFDGVNYLVVWSEDSSTSSPARIRGARVRPDGTVLDPDGIFISDEQGSPRAPTLTFDGTQFLVVWEESLVEPDPLPSRIHGARVLPDGTVRDPRELEFLSATDAQVTAAVASNGTNSLLAWIDLDSKVLGVRIGPDGSVLDAAPLVLFQGYLYSDLEVFFDGARYVVTWEGAGAIGVNRVTPEGAVLDGTGRTLPGTQGHSNARLGRTPGSGPLFVTRFNSGVFAQRLSAELEPLDPQPAPVTFRPSRQGQPSVSFDGARYLVAWQDERGGALGLYGAWVDAAGQRQGEPFLLVQRACSGPVSTFDGENHFVACPEPVGLSQRLFWLRVRPDGTVLDPGGISHSATVEDSLALAFNGTHQLLAWRYRRWLGRYDEHRWEIRALRVGHNGQVAGDELCVGCVNELTQMVGPPSVATDGEDFLVAWSFTRGNGQSRDLRAKWVRADGTVPQGDDAALVLDPQLKQEVRPVLDFDGSRYLVLWQSEGLRAMQVERSGELHASEAPALGTEGFEQPALSFEGPHHLLTWSHEGTHVARLDASGQVAGRFTLHPEASDSQARAAFDGQGHALVAYRVSSVIQRYTTPQVRLRLLNLEPAPPVSPAPPANGCGCASSAMQPLALVLVLGLLVRRARAG
jgi:hypothetical protein